MDVNHGRADLCKSSDDFGLNGNCPGLASMTPSMLAKILSYTDPDECKPHQYLSRISHSSKSMLDSVISFTIEFSPDGRSIAEYEREIRPILGKEALDSWLLAARSQGRLRTDTPADRGRTINFQRVVEPLSEIPATVTQDAEILNIMHFLEFTNTGLRGFSISASLMKRLGAAGRSAARLVSSSNVNPFTSEGIRQIIRRAIDDPSSPIPLNIRVVFACLLLQNSRDSEERALVDQYLARIESVAGAPGQFIDPQILDLLFEALSPHLQANFDLELTQRCIQLACNLSENTALQFRVFEEEKLSFSALDHCMRRLASNPDNSAMVELLKQYLKPGESLPLPFLSVIASSACVAAKHDLDLSKQLLFYLHSYPDTRDVNKARTILNQHIANTIEHHLGHDRDHDEALIAHFHQIFKDSCRALSTSDPVHSRTDPHRQQVIFGSWIESDELRNYHNATCALSKVGNAKVASTVLNLLKGAGDSSSDEGINELGPLLYQMGTVEIEALLKMLTPHLNNSDDAVSDQTVKLLLEFSRKEGASFITDDACRNRYSSVIRIKSERIRENIRFGWVGDQIESSQGESPAFSLEEYVARKKERITMAAMRVLYHSDPCFSDRMLLEHFKNLALTQDRIGELASDLIKRSLVARLEKIDRAVAETV